jgi:quinol monooxygenase YgiN
VNFMAYARVSHWRYKKGMREEALKVIKEFGDNIPRSDDYWDGFKGVLVFPSLDDPDAALLITLWENEDRLKASRSGIFKDATANIEKYIESPPEVKNYVLDSAEVQF